MVNSESANPSGAHCESSVQGVSSSRIDPGVTLYVYIATSYDSYLGFPLLS